nr:hypothetical protein [Chroococcidiopsis sp. CCMEE 29]
MSDYTQAGRQRPATSSAKVAKKHQSNPKNILTANPGDRIIKVSQTLEEKSKQLAVDAPDITGDHIKVPTYFIVEYSNGEKKALHHVRDAKEISDVIRQGQFQEKDWIEESEQQQPYNFNLSPLILIFALFLLTVPILIGIF